MIKLVLKKSCSTLCFVLLSLPYALAQSPAEQAAANKMPEAEVSCTEMKVYDIVEEESVPVGGLSAFYQYLSDNFVYPKEAVKRNIHGTTYIRFVISHEGNVVCAEIIEGREVGWGLDEEAVRVLSMTRWHPAKQQGEAVNQRKILPFNFKPQKPAVKGKGK